MKAYIIEDEILAQKNLIRLLGQYFPEIQVAATATSVRESVEFLSKNTPEIVFMDVELSDGVCFDIFDKTNVRSQVIMTTAYDHYAVKAFEINSVDYLLKPLEPGALRRAVERCIERNRKEESIDIEAILSAFKHKEENINKRFIVRQGEMIIPIEASDIAYLHSEEKSTFLVTKEGLSYIIDQSLDLIKEELPPASFFRISRSCIMSMSSISSVARQMGGRLKVIARPPANFDMTVSRSRVDAFLKWLEG